MLAAKTDTAVASRVHGRRGESPRVLRWSVVVVAVRSGFKRTLSNRLPESPWIDSPLGGLRRPCADLRRFAGVRVFPAPRRFRARLGRIATSRRSTGRAVESGEHLWERDRQRAAGAATLAAAREGRGGTVFFMGEAGLGKTALLDDVCRQADGDLVVARARCDPMEAALPFGVLWQIVH